MIEKVKFKLLVSSKFVVKSLDEVNNSHLVHFMNCLKHNFKIDFNSQGTPSTGEMEILATGGIPQYWGNADFYHPFYA